MNVREIRLNGFRNYEEFSSEFSERVNVVIGDNAQEIGRAHV
jgi:recombinational DNA repair ATPase RecF